MGGGRRVADSTGCEKAVPFICRTPNSIADYTIFSVLDDTQGFLWMGTSRGIVRVRREQLQELAQQKRKTLDYVLLGKADGMPSSECVGVAQPSATRMEGWQRYGLPLPKASPTAIPTAWVCHPRILLN